MVYRDRRYFDCRALSAVGCPISISCRKPRFPSSLSSRSLLPQAHPLSSFGSGARVSGQIVALGPSCARGAIAFGVAAELTVMPPDRSARMIGHTTVPDLIPFPPLGPLACFLHALRRGAPEKPTLQAIAGCRPPPRCDFLCTSMTQPAVRDALVSDRDWDGDRDGRTYRPMAVAMVAPQIAAF